MMRRRLGLTLLELLISLLLLAMISTAMASVTGYAVRLFDRSEGLRDRSEQMHHRTLLRGWIVRAAASEFTGTPDALTFRTRSDTALAWTTGLLHVRLIPTEAGAELLVGDVPDTAQHRLHLSDTNLRLSYFGKKEGETGWHETWTGQDTLPLLIRISGTDPALRAGFIAMPRLSAE
ncbi:prepilin-type N-terminal cleavage/methylation domain-containing protein [Roseobacter sp. MH60115]|uniref:prepilin-type N-terminal cleavage/methylation domain-containing protein n=1 Tax=Roseobacter sp. MH60115 TaxID=2785324 RepID=UPI0018A30A09|nr:prepilin-type N-terminal cleavage/methylation domain-containing protein [Roseobacter sp. MH60115]